MDVSVIVTKHFFFIFGKTKLYLEHLLLSRNQRAECLVGVRRATVLLPLGILNRTESQLIEWDDYGAPQTFIQSQFVKGKQWIVLCQGAFDIN